VDQSTDTLQRTDTLQKALRINLDGRSATAAQHWVADTDEPNARLIEGTRSRADLVVRLGPAS
jgi:hypothetical protein